MHKDGRGVTGRLLAICLGLSLLPSCVRVDIEGPDATAGVGRQAADGADGSGGDRQPPPESAPDGMPGHQETDATIDAGAESDAASCGGTLYNGLCWYWAAPMESCTAGCATRGAYHVATRDYAGSSGSPANCEHVMTALGIPDGTITWGPATRGLGCVFRGDGTRWWVLTPATNEGDEPTVPGSRRVCACNN